MLLLVGDRSFGMKKTTLVAKCAVGPDQHIIRYTLSKNFNLKNVSKDLLGFSVEVRVHNGHVVVASYHISQSRETLFHSLYFDCVGQRVTNLLQFLICSCHRDQKSVSVTHSHSPYNSAAGDRGVDYGDHIV